MIQVRRWPWLAVVAAVLALGGCATDDGLVPPGEGTPTTRERLADERPMLRLSPTDSLVQIAARVNRGDHWDEGVADLRIDEGRIWLGATADGRLVIDELAIELDDVVLTPEQYPPRGLHLTDLGIRLREAAPGATEWASDEQACFASASLDLELAWSLVVGDAAYPLAPQRLNPVEVAVQVFRSGDELFVDLMSQPDGVLWGWAGIVELHDLQLIVHGSEHEHVVL